MTNPKMLTFLNQQKNHILQFQIGFFFSQKIMAAIDDPGHEITNFIYYIYTSKTSDFCVRVIVGHTLFKKLY